jgi:hypothetical protein
MFPEPVYNPEMLEFWAETQKGVFGNAAKPHVNQGAPS